MKNASDTMWNEVVVNKFEILLRYLLAENEKNLS